VSTRCILSCIIGQCDFLVTNIRRVKHRRTQDFTTEGFTGEDRKRSERGFVPGGLGDEVSQKLKQKCEISVQFLTFSCIHNLVFNEYKSRAWTVFFCRHVFNKIPKIQWGGVELPLALLWVRHCSERRRRCDWTHWHGTAFRTGHTSCSLWASAFRSRDPSPWPSCRTRLASSPDPAQPPLHTPQCDNHNRKYSSKKYVCITTNLPDTKSHTNPYPNPNPREHKSIQHLHTR